MLLPFRLSGTVLLNVETYLINRFIFNNCCFTGFNLVKCLISSSRQEFVNAYVDYVFNTSVDPLFEYFYAGFHKVCGGKVLELFQPNELQAMVIGNTNYDWTDLEKVSI